MSWSRRIRRKIIWGAALGFAAVAVTSTTAAGMARHDLGSASVIPYLSHGMGITRDVASASSVDAKSLIEQHLANEARDAARAGFVSVSAHQSTRNGGPVFQSGLPDGYVGSGVALDEPAAGVAQPDGYQPQLRGEEALVIRDKPDGYQPQTRGAEVAVVATGDSIDWANIAFGFGLGLGLAALCVLMLLERGRARTAAHS